MKKNLVIKAIIAMLVIFSVVSGSTGIIAHAASNTLKAGAYTVGKNLSPGLNKFTISDGTAEFYVERGEYIIIDEYLDSENYEDSNQFIANLKNGDIVRITKGSSPVKVESISKIDLKKVSNGFYEVGTDIPAGTYTLNLDNPAHEYDEAYISVFDKNYDDIEYNIIAPEDKPTHTFNKGDKVYVYFMIGTMSFTQKVITPTSITLNKSSLSLKVDQSAKLTATVKPDNATNKGINWSSTNTSVATVDANGNVKAMKAGNATITATAKGNTSVKKSISVTVTKIVPTSIKLSKSTLNITKNQSIKVTATVSPDNAADKTVQWKSSNTKVATVDAKGNIKGIANGKATITATAKDNTKVSKTLAVTVSTKTVKVNKTSLSITEGKSETLKATVSPSDSTDKTVSWKSSNTKIAKVDSKGKVTGVKKGNATITASVKGAKDVKVKVSITAPVAAKSVKLNKTSATLAKGKTLTLTATVSPSNTTNKTVKWKSSDTKVAKIDSKGKVTAIGAGTAKITATTTNGKTSTATITVPYTKSLGAGKYKAGDDLPAGRYKITTNSGTGNLVIAKNNYDRFVNEILTNEDDDFGVTAVTTDIKSGDSIEISGLNSVQFTKVSNVKSNTLHAGYWTVGKDINPGKYKITTPSGYGNLIVYRGSSLLVNEILSDESDGYAVTSVTATLKDGDRINIGGLNKVVFNKK